MKGEKLFGDFGGLEERCCGTDDDPKSNLGRRPDALYTPYICPNAVLVNVMWCRNLSEFILDFKFIQV